MKMFASNIKFILYHIYLLLFVFLLSISSAYSSDRQWSDLEIAAIQSLWIGNLEQLPTDRSNRVADDERAVSLGRKIFFDTSFSSNGLVACATCHVPDKEFQDGIQLGKGVGTTSRRTMPIAGTAYSPFLFWDGRKDSLWAQALGPLESAVEHGGNRTQYAHLVGQQYREPYEAIFGSLPDLEDVPANAGPVTEPEAAYNWSLLSSELKEAVTEIFVNIGKVLAAYERRIQFTKSRFDAYVEELIWVEKGSSELLTADEKAGLRLFIGKANCLQCHNGPLFTNQEFHNTGVPAVTGLPLDQGRLTGASAVVADEFNCRSRWSDIDREGCLELEFMVTDSHELEGAYKVPTLRNVSHRAPYMHAGQFEALKDVLLHYSNAPSAQIGHSEIKRLRLNAREILQLEAFLSTLSSDISEPTVFQPVNQQRNQQ